MMKRKIALLLALLSLGAASCKADTLKQAADIFELTDDGQRLQIVTVLDEGTEYEPIETLTAQTGTAFDSYFYADDPIEWAKISYQDRDGLMRQGWMVVNPEAVTGINMSVFEDSNEEYNGYDQGFVLCETLSLRESPNAELLTTLGYGAYCTIIGEDGSWYHVIYRDERDRRYSGWVQKDYVLVNPSYFHPDGETPVYAVPSVDSKRIGLISEGTDYPIIGEYNGFWVISLRGASGFVCKP